MEWSIQQIAQLAGTTSRALRHYDETGLVPPSRTGANGYRYYDADALVRLQRVLLLRGLGLGIPAIAQVLAGERDDEHALVRHLEWLRAEQLRLDRQIASVETTIETLRGGEKPMAEKMFDGFDHTEFRDEVVERWGETAYADSDAWWRGLSNAQKVDFQDASVSLIFDWVDGHERGLDPAGDEAQTLARRQYAFLAGIPGVPRGTTGPSAAYYTALGEMYVADSRFAKNYGGVAGATFVRDAMHAFAAKNL